jgi:phosphate transport system protein
MPIHLEESLQRGIELIRKKVLEMSGLAEQALKRSLDALIENKRQLAYSVILRDLYIDEAEKELDRLCLEFLVRQQPAAGHLRFVYAAIKINNELERIGDYAESVARQFLTISAIEAHPPYTKFIEIANLAIPMLHNAIKAFVDRNVDLARETMELEEKVDQIRNDIHQELVEWREQGKLPLEALAPLMIIASRFERVADQSCNICEEVLYMCTGEYIKHKGTEVFRILFVDDDNACTSQIAEGIANAMGQSKFVFSSAGIHPTAVDQRAVSFMAEKGIDISHHAAKSLASILHLEHYQVVVALTKQAQQAFPDAPTKTVSIFWEVKDPSRARGTSKEKEGQNAYENAFQFLDTHIRDLIEAVLGNEKQ